MTFIIPCSSNKRNPLINPESQPSNLENLLFDEHLNQIRQDLIQEKNQDLDWNHCLPAWKLYTGRLYTQVNIDNWLKNVDIKIVSALFGVIRHTDLIPYYDLAMDRQLHAFWRNINLNIFFEENDKDLLSINYRKAFNYNGNPIAFVPEVWNDRYGVHRGNWLNNQLNNL